MKKFITVVYEIKSEKIKKEPITLVMISDLHNVEFGEGNSRLLKEIKKCRPDAALIAGDLVLGKKGASTKSAIEFLEKLRKITEVLFAPGNHEQRMKQFPSIYGNEFARLEAYMDKAGIRYLDNKKAQLTVRGEPLCVYGLNLPYTYYEKKQKKKGPEKKELSKWMGNLDTNSYSILLAHTPRYAENYFAWGADLILSGHYHGGMVRLPFLGGIISPDFRLFPSYCHGIVQKGWQNMLTGAGLGEHTIPIRIHNPRELVVVKLMPKN